MLFNTILNNVWDKESAGNITLSEVRSRMKKTFEHDYNDLSEDTKRDFSERYSVICKVVIGI
jgi:hypothetical protein